MFRDFRRKLRQGFTLCIHLAKREMHLRYRASFLGFGWAVVYPLCMLGVYSLVFGVILRIRWGESAYDCIPALFCGLTAFNIFASLANRAPVLVMEHRNYVRSSNFPVVLLPLVALLTALMDGFIGFILLVAMNALFFGRIFWTALWLPICLLPLVLLALGFCWLISSIAVYVRDLTSITPIVVTLTFFLSPIVYPLSSAPESLRHVLLLNPITGTVENLRNTVIWGVSPNWEYWIQTTAIGLAVAIIGYFVFKRLREGFADAL